MKKQAFGMVAALFALMLALFTGVYAADTSAAEPDAPTETDAAEPDAPTETDAANTAYAILYKDGTLVFQNSAASDGRPVKATYEVDLNAVYTEKSPAPWYNERESVRVVNFADKLSPGTTAFWFYDCSKLERVDNIGNLDTSNVTDMSGMFFDCMSLEALDVSRFDTSNVTDMSMMFNGCGFLEALDVSRFDTSNVTDMSMMFNGCGGLTALDVSRFDTSKVMDMSCMFWGCNDLTALDVSRFDTSNVTDMSQMFYICMSLEALDVSRFDTSNVTDMSAMFRSCSGLEALDVSRFDTSNVTDMGWMFYYCGGLTALDASSFDTANVTNMRQMFRRCSNLKTIYASDKFITSSVVEGDYTGSKEMFFGCAALVGGNGTKYDESHTDKEYARIDTASAPGYFTYKAAPVFYKITAAVPNNGKLSVTLTNPGAATLAVSYFDANGKFVSAHLQDVQANAGTLESPIPANAKAARVMLLDDDFRPLCAAHPATL